MKSIVAFALILNSAFAGAETDDFAASCARLAADAVFTATFEDKSIGRHNDIAMADLTRISRSLPGPHSTLGVTRAEPSARLALSLNTLTHRDGRVCAAPSLQLTLGFSVLEVYLARELHNPCRRHIVDEHEDEHVHVWRNHLRIAARLLPQVLRQPLGQPAYFESAGAAESALRSRAEQEIARQLEKLKEGIAAAHREIDSPGSYRTVENRMRACS